MNANTTTYIALLRGINVGGNTIISMRELAACFTELGFRDVKTFINSGNVIFRTGQTSPRKLEQTIEKAIEARFSYAVAVVVRSKAEMDQLMQSIPKSWQTAADQKLNVIFLRHTVDDPDILKNFRPKPDIERLHYYPGVLFWSAATSSLTKSSMIKISSLPLYKEVTVRIFNSVRRMYEIMQQTDKL